MSSPTSSKAERANTESIINACDGLTQIDSNELVRDLASGWRSKLLGVITIKGLRNSLSEKMKSDARKSEKTENGPVNLTAEDVEVVGGSGAVDHLDVAHLDLLAVVLASHLRDTRIRRLSHSQHNRRTGQERSRTRQGRSQTFARSARGARSSARGPGLQEDNAKYFEPTHAGKKSYPRNRGGGASRGRTGASTSAHR